jgi:hypothetical protein
MGEPITVHRMLELINEHSHLSLLPALAAGQAALLLEVLLAQPRYQEPARLARHRARVYSQDGTDGILAEIFRRLGRITPLFLEIGAGDGQENNTRFWLEQGWRGAWIEADPDKVAAILAGFAPEIAERRLDVLHHGVTRENVAELVAATGLPPEIGLLSLDIDYNTSHVWRMLGALRPEVAVIEYNPNFPPSVRAEVPYLPRGRWAGDNHFGAGLKVLEEIGRELGYALVGADLTGLNAYFVRGDLVHPGVFAAPYTAENHYEPPRFHLLRLGGHAPALRDTGAQEAAA